MYYALQAAIERGRDQSLVLMRAERCGPEIGLGGLCSKIGLLCYAAIPAK